MLMSTAIFAQKLPSEQVEVMKKFEANLAQSKKLTTTPLLQAIETQPATLSYTVPTRLLTLQYEPPSLKPIALKREKPLPTYNFYSKLGYGFPSMPYADIHYSSGASDKLAYDIHAFHNSANNTGNIENQRFGETKIDLGVTSYNENFAIGGNLGYDHDVVHFYGYENSDTSEVFARDSVRQRFSNIHGGLTLFNSERTRGDLNYNVGLDFYNLSDAYEANEFGVDVHAELVKWFSDAHPFKVKIGNDFTRFNNDSIRPSNNLFYLQPNFTYHGSSFIVKLGANINGADSSFYFQPDVEAQVNLAGDKFAIIAGAVGEVQKNTFLSITNYNPFINNEQRLLNTRKNHYYGGLRGTFNGFSFEGKVGYIQYNNLALYLNDSTDTKRFDVLYDDANSVNIHGSVSFTAVKNLDIGGTIDVNTYTMDSLGAAFHLPNFEMNVNAKYRLMDDKLTLRAELYTLGGITYLDENSVEANTGALFDLNLGADYQFTDKFGVFIDLNNVTNQQFQRWNMYPNFGFNMMAGVTLKF